MAKRSLLRPGSADKSALYAQPLRRDLAYEGRRSLHHPYPPAPVRLIQPGGRPISAHKLISPACIEGAFHVRASWHIGINRTNNTT